MLRLSRPTAHHHVDDAPTTTGAPLPRERVRSTAQRRHRTCGGPSCLTLPVFEIPEGAVPAAQCRPELSRNCRHLRATYNRNDHAGFDHHIVHGNEQCRSLDGIKLTFGRMKEVIVGLIVPASRITTLPFVFFCRYFR